MNDKKLNEFVKKIVQGEIDTKDYSESEKEQIIKIFESMEQQVSNINHIINSFLMFMFSVTALLLLGLGNNPNYVLATISSILYLLGVLTKKVLVLNAQNIINEVFKVFGEEK